MNRAAPRELSTRTVSPSVMPRAAASAGASIAVAAPWRRRSRSDWLNEEFRKKRFGGRVHTPEHDEVGADHLLGIVARDLADRHPPAGVRRRDADRTVEPARAESVEERMARVVLHLNSPAPLGPTRRSGRRTRSGE
jgi:hypothetical protein